MQRVGADGRKRIVLYVLLPIFILALGLFLDLWTKAYFEKEKMGQGIKGVFSFYYTFNEGAAFSFLADKEWGQLFFKIITPLALLFFCCFFVYTFKKRYLFANIGVSLMITGTIGNYIDRLLFSGVRDFIKLEFIDFAIFNIADSLLCVGVAILVVHFLFLDDNAVFKKNVKESDSKDNESD